MHSLQSPPVRSPVVGSAGLIGSAAFVVVAVGALCTVDAHAERIAVLQVEAPGLLVGAREELEEQVRQGLRDAGVDVQDGARTAGFVKDAAAAGLACSLNDDECALKVAVAADVDGVVVGRLVSLRGRTALELSLVTLDGARAAVAGSDPPRLCGRRLKEPSAGPPTPLPQPIVVEPGGGSVVIDGKDVVVDDSGVVWLSPGAHRLVVVKGGYVSKELVFEVKGDRLPPPVSLVLEKEFPVVTGVGLVVAGGGVVVATVAGLVALLVDQTLASGVTPQEVDDARASGLVALGICGVGVVATGAGAALAVVGGLE